MAARSITPDSQSSSLDLILRAKVKLPPSAGRLGVIGGAYNPITRAHLVLAREASAQFQLHEVIFVLSKVSPHKSLHGASVEQRLAMMRLGVKGNTNISIGLCSHGLFLDISTALRQVYPQNTEIFFITGRDAAERILTWPYVQPAEALARMFAAFQLLVFERQGALTLLEHPLIKQHTDRIHLLPLAGNLDKVSSTRVRRLAGADAPIHELVPAEVASFIAEHRLYQEFADR